MSQTAYIALSLVQGIGRVRFEELLDAFGTADSPSEESVPLP